MAHPAVFLDRDGTINVNAPSGDYVTSPEGLKLLPGAAEAVRQLADAGFRVVVVTNQSCVGKGLVSSEELREIHVRLRDMLSEAGAEVDLVLHCPHTSADDCDCRKPAPGMWLRAAGDLDLDLASSYTAGDAARDLQAGRIAGTRTVFVWGDAYPGEPAKAREFGPDMEAETLREAAGMIVADARERGVIR